MSALFVARAANGSDLVGVPVDLGGYMARALGAALAITAFPNSGLCTDALVASSIDVAFLPADQSRRERVDFGPAYFAIESTYLVTGASGIASLADVDDARVRVIGIADTTTIRSAARTLSHTSTSRSIRLTRQFS